MLLLPSVPQIYVIKSSYPAKISRPDLLKSTEVIPQRILSCPKQFTSPYERISNMRQVESSEPVPDALPWGKNNTELISDSWPTWVWTHFPERISHTLAVESTLPETNTLLFGGLIAFLLDRAGGELDDAAAVDVPLQSMLYPYFRSDIEHSSFSILNN